MLARLLRYSGIALLLAVLAIGPFFRGLFFWTELLAAISLVSVGFVLWLIGRRLGGQPVSLTGGAPGLALLALLACYLSQIGWAVYPRGNLDWVLRVAAGFMAYVMMRAEAGPALRRWVGWLLVLSAAGVAILGFLEFTGFLSQNPEIAQTLKLVNLGPRMATPLQYWNTAAIYFLAALFAAVGLATEEQNWWQRSVLSGLGTLLSLAFFFTTSRGSVVVLPFGLLLLVIGMDRDKRWPSLLFLLAAWAPMTVALKGVGANAAIHNWVSAFRWITAAAVGGGVAGFVLTVCVRLLSRKLQIALAGGALVLGLAVLIVIGPGGSWVPKQANRLTDINFQTPNVVLRLIYDRDAARMVADRPLGRGGWGWDRSYRQYQAFNYTARETHDHYAQTAVEAGVLGLLALVAAVVGSLVTTWRNRKGNSLGWALAAGGLLVAVHSLIDFDLSYGVVWLLVWATVAAGAAPAANRRWEARGWWPSLSLAVITAGLASALCIGSAYADQAQALEEAQQPDQAVTVARRSIRFDPWNSDPYLIIGDRAALQRAAAVDPGRAEARFRLAIKRELEKDLPAALKEARAALADQPMVSDHYTKVAGLAGTLMVDAVGRGDQAEARRLAADLVAMASDFARRKAAGDALQYLWGSPELVMDPVFQLRYGQALYLTGNSTAAEPHLKAAAQVGLLGSEADVWLYAIYERRGDNAAMTSLEAKPWIRFRTGNPVYQAIRRS